MSGGSFDLGPFPTGRDAGGHDAVGGARAGGDGAGGRVLRLRAQGTEALLAVPAQVRSPAPLLVLFHGSGGRPQQVLALVQDVAGAAGAVVLAPASTQYTWDVIVGRPGPDVDAVRALLAQAAAEVPLDAGAVCFGGFSDGASYALTLGLANPQLVEAVVAFSPGFFVDGEVRAVPRCFVSHGTGDAVLPIGRTSRRIVPLLEGAGHDVTSVEFDGGHEVPPAVVERALRWWLERS